MQLCLMASKFEPLNKDDDEVSYSSCDHSELNTVSTEYTSWFLTERENVSVPRLAKKESSLSEFGVEKPLIEYSPDLHSTSSSRVYSTGSSDSVSYASVTDSSENSQSDLNSVTTDFISLDDSFMYELFPANSFSSLTGIKCHAIGFGKGLGRKNLSEAVEAKMATVDLVKGRSRTRKHDSNYSGVVAAIDDEEVDSIIECKATE